MLTRESIIEKLREFLGDKRFRLMYGQVNELAGKKELRFWHYRSLAEFEQQESVELPRSPDALAEFLRGAISEPPVLTQEQTPEWLHIDELETPSPVQASGWCYVGDSERDPKAVVWFFYFHAKERDWSLGASDTYDPVDVFGNDEHAYYYEEFYESGTDEYSAGYMPPDTARYYIVRELAKLRAQRSGR